MPAWPVYASIMRADFGIERESALIRSNMESGPPKQTRVKSRVMATMAIRAGIKGKTNYEAFLTWWRDTLNYGADWFDLPDPVAGTTIQARIVGGQLGRAVPVGGRPADANTRWEIPMTLEYWDA